MKTIILIITLLAGSFQSFAQKVEVSGKVTDSTNGRYVIEIVVNDTLAKVVKDPKQGRSKYIRMYQDPAFVVRTDSTGTFKIKALPTDTLYFKSYGHKVQTYLVSDLIQRKDIHIKLEPEADASE
jgi:hypothetical protein